MGMPEKHLMKKKLQEPWTYVPRGTIASGSHELVPFSSMHRIPLIPCWDCESTGERGTPILPVSTTERTFNIVTEWNSTVGKHAVLPTHRAGHRSRTPLDWLQQSRSSLSDTGGRGVQQVLLSQLLQMTTAELLKQIRIPPEYASTWDVSPTDTPDLTARLEKWKIEVPVSLGSLASHFAVSGDLSMEEQSLVVMHVAQFIGDDPWVSADTRSKAGRKYPSSLCPSETHTLRLIEILQSYVSPGVPLIMHILSDQVRPVFQSHSHPKVNPSTGRALSRVAGGPLASQDLYTSQSWKTCHPGISNVLLWLVTYIKVKTFHVVSSSHLS